MKRMLTELRMEMMVALVLAALLVCIGRVYINLNSEAEVSEVPVQRERNIVRPFSRVSRETLRIELNPRQPRNMTRIGVEPNDASRDSIGKEQAVTLVTSGKRTQVPEPRQTVESDGANGNDVILCGKRNVFP